MAAALFVSRSPEARLPFARPLAERSAGQTPEAPAVQVATVFVDGQMLHGDDAAGWSKR